MPRSQPFFPAYLWAAPAAVSYSAAPSQVDAYDFAEITATVSSPDAHDPFEDTTLTGTITTDPGKTYALCLPRGGDVTIQLKPGHYSAYWFSAMPGGKIDLPPVEGPSWTSPVAPDRNDWALLLRAAQ